MKRRLLATAALGALTAGAWFLNNSYIDPMIERAFVSLAVVTIVYGVLHLGIEPILLRSVERAKMQYAARKTISVTFIVIILIALLRIWVESTQALLVSYGLLGAGVAVALQDVFKNLAGGVFILASRPYSIGDRIEVNDTAGDVVDIGILYTTVMEMKEWVPADQSTGRFTILPNQIALSSTIHNYTRDNTFIWDEIALPITYDSDWKAAKEAILDIVKEETEDTAHEAKEEISVMQRQYYLAREEVKPNIYLELTDNWITFHVRYITDVRSRRPLHNAITRRMLETVEEMDEVTVASETLSITDLPDLNMSQTE